MLQSVSVCYMPHGKTASCYRVCYSANPWWQLFRDQIVHPKPWAVNMSEQNNLRFFFLGMSHGATMGALIYVDSKGNMTLLHKMSWQPAVKFSVIITLWCSDWQQALLCPQVGKYLGDEFWTSFRIQDMGKTLDECWESFHVHSEKPVLIIAKDHTV